MWLHLGVLGQQMGYSGCWLEGLRRSHKERKTDETASLTWTDEVASFTGVVPGPLFKRA